MEWAIISNSANILTHLRELGYPIPLSIVEKYPLVVRDYLLGESSWEEEGGMESEGGGVREGGQRVRGWQQGIEVLFPCRRVPTARGAEVQTPGVEGAARHAFLGGFHHVGRQ